MIRDNLSIIRERIQAACSKNNREPNQITIVAISKASTVEKIKEAVESGITDIGENRVPEALSKYNAILLTQYAQRIKWHMVGHLQSNKVKEAVRIFDLIQSVDSLHLAAEVDKQAAKINKIQDILIEVNTSGEQSKYGLKLQEAIEVIKEISRLKNINIKGLMTVAPIVDEPGKAGPYFMALRELLNEINEHNGPNKINVLSMGMTDDFEAAIKEGANMLRLGRAIFEVK